VDFTLCEWDFTLCGVGGEGRGREQGGDMAQTMYAHMNKWKKQKLQSIGVLKQENLIIQKFPFYSIGFRV
jgi:hypothetical protein